MERFNLMKYAKLGNDKKSDDKQADKLGNSSDFSCFKLKNFFKVISLPHTFS